VFLASGRVTVRLDEGGDPNDIHSYRLFTVSHH
jgi:hypothetical protein